MKHRKYLLLIIIITGLTYYLATYWVFNFFTLQQRLPLFTFKFISVSAGFVGLIVLDMFYLVKHLVNENGYLKIPAIFFFLLMLCGCVKGPKLAHQEISGLVVKKYKTNPGCFGEIVISTQSRVDTLKDICYCVIEEAKLFQYVMPKDSLYKARYSTIVSVIRGDSVKKFDLPACYR